jgi:alpha-1,6-mannosyltransferase
MTRLSVGGHLAAPYALIFILVFWGSEAWSWSGFLHWFALPYVAPYPSTFAAALTLLSLSLLLDHLAQPRLWRLVVLGLLTSLTLLVHPTTAVVLLASLPVVLVTVRGPDRIRRAVPVVLTVALATALAIAWPYFSLLSLLTTRSPDFDKDSLSLYERTIVRIWPALVLLPAALWRLRSDRRSPAVFIFAFLGMIYCIGAVSGAYGLGRVIAWVVVFIDISAAQWAPVLYDKLGGNRRLLVPTLTLLAAVGLIVVNRAPLQRASRATGQQTWQSVAAVLGSVGADDVVLSDLDTSWMIPALTGKVVASIHPLYWVPDAKQREQDLLSFFLPATADLDRMAILSRYGAHWMLINEASPELSASGRVRLEKLGHVVARAGALTLLATARR